MAQQVQQGPQGQQGIVNPSTSPAPPPTASPAAVITPSATPAASAGRGAPGAPGTKDNRLKMLDATIKRHSHQPDALLEVLHTAQELFGYLDRTTLLYVGRALRVPPSRVFGVATFYNFFSLKPKGAHTCVVCMGTACYVKGADAILSAVQRAHGVAVNGTTPDGQLSLVTARCIGACGLAPALVLDNEIAGRMSAETTLARLNRWVTPRATEGAGNRATEGAGERPMPKVPGGASAPEGAGRP